MTEMEEVKARLDLVEAAIRHTYTTGTRASPDHRGWLLNALAQEADKSDAHAKWHAEWEAALRVRD